QRILETALYVADIDTAEQFYRELFGLVPYSKDPPRHLFFKVGDGMLLLFNPEESRKAGTVPSHGAVGEGHVAFSITHAQLEFWRNRLGQLGIAIEQEHTWPSGGHSIYFRDPFGNSLELATPDTWP
ncbi:MAG: glyoxalase/bleomycin resistance/extradiol dioxygenase family protein, partial [Calditrichaeota bacterium]